MKPPICQKHNCEMTLSSNENYWYCFKCEEQKINSKNPKKEIKKCSE